MPRLIIFLTRSAFAVWLGGLTFYAAVVIPVGHDVLGSHREVGFITRQVTPYLNAIGVFAIALGWCEWKAAAQPDNRGTAWILGALSLSSVLLFVLHPVLNDHLDAATRSIDAPDTFYQLHRIYLLVTTLQWLAGLVLAWRWTRGAAGSG